MKIKELQEWVEDDWSNRSKNRPSLELQILFLMEEVGEIAEAIRKNLGSKERKDIKTNIGSEISDALICLCTIANHFEVDLEKELAESQKKIEDRHNRGY